MSNYVNTQLFETVYTDPSGQDWKVKLNSATPIYTGVGLGEGAAPLSAETGYVVTWTWSNQNDPDTGGNYPGTHHIQVDESTGAPFTNFATAEAYTLTTAFTTNTLIDQTTVQIVSAADSSIPRNWYRKAVDMAAPGLQVRWEGDADDMNKSIMGSSADLSVYVDDYQEDILRRAILLSEFNLTLHVYKKDDAGDFVDWWHGIGLPESFAIEVREGKKLMDLAFTDGLSILNDIDWKNADGTIKSGRLTLRQIIMESLRRLPHFSDMNFKVPGVEYLSIDESASNELPQAGYALHQLTADHTGYLLRVTNDPTFLEFHDIYPGDDLTPYDGYKVIIWEDQFGNSSLIQFSYNDAPTLNAAERAVEFNGLNQYLYRPSGLLSGDRKKCIVTSIDPDTDTTSGAILSQGDSAILGSAAQMYLLQVENDQFAHRFDGAAELYSVTTNATLNNQVLTSRIAADGVAASNWQLFSNNTELTATTSTGSLLSTSDIAAANTYVGTRPLNGTLGNFYNGKMHALVIWNDDFPGATVEEATAQEFIDIYQNGQLPVSEQKGGWILSTYGTPTPVSADYDTWDPSVKDPLTNMTCLAETFNEEKQEYDRRFEMRPDPGFISTGHVLEDICKTMGMVFTHWEGGYHLFSPAYLQKATINYAAVPDPASLPHAWRWTWNYTDGLRENTYESVNIDREMEDYAAPADGMTKSFTMPYGGVKLVHEKSPSDVIVGVYGASNEYHKLSPLAGPLGGIFTQDDGTDLFRFGDAVQGHPGDTNLSRKRRKGFKWSFFGELMEDGSNVIDRDPAYPTSFDVVENSGQMGNTIDGPDGDPRTQQQRAHADATNNWEGFINHDFFNGRYIGPDSTTVNDLDLEAGEEISIEVGAFVKNGYVENHIGQTHVFRHRIEVTDQDGERYRLSRPVITMDVFDDGTGLSRLYLIDGGSSKVDGSWAGNKIYFPKGYGELEWVKLGDMPGGELDAEWMGAFYEIMGMHPETTKNEGEDLADMNISQLDPEETGYNPLGTEWNEDKGRLDVNKDQRYAYIKSDLKVELPGTAGVTEFNSLYTEVGVACYRSSHGPNSLRKELTGTSAIDNYADWYTRNADGSRPRHRDGSFYLTDPTIGGSGSPAYMPHTFGWNKYIIRYGEKGERNKMTTYADGGSGVRFYDAGSSRLASRLVYSNPEYKGRIKVEHMDGSGANSGAPTFHTSWRPQQYWDVVGNDIHSLHELVSYEMLDLLSFSRARYLGTWVKHPGTSQGGCPAPFLPAVTRCLDPDNAVRIMPYRMTWDFIDGFKCESLEIAPAYEKQRITFNLGESDTGGTGGNVNANSTKLEPSAPQKRSPEQAAGFFEGSSDTSLGGTDTFGTYNLSTATNDGTGTYYEELYAANTGYISNTEAYINKFGLVLDSDQIALYGAGNLARFIVEEPGMYLVEVKGRLDNAAASGSNTYGFAMHRLGEVVNGTYVGDTQVKGSNAIESFDRKTGSTGSGDWLSGTWTEQVRLNRGDIISFSAFNTAGSTTMRIYNSPEELKIKLLKLTEQQG